VEQLKHEDREVDGDGAMASDLPLWVGCSSSMPHGEQRHLSDASGEHHRGEEKRREEKRPDAPQ